MEFYNITYIYVFEVEEFNSDTFRIIPPPVDLENSSTNRKYWNFEVTHLFQLVEFYDITYVYVFEFEEFNSDTFRTIAPTIFLKKSVRTGSTGTLRLPIFLPGGIL